MGFLDEDGGNKRVHPMEVVRRLEMTLDTVKYLYIPLFYFISFCRSPKTLSPPQRHVERLQDIVMKIFKLITWPKEVIKNQTLS